MSEAVKSMWIITRGRLRGCCSVDDGEDHIGRGSSEQSSTFTREEYNDPACRGDQSNKITEDDFDDRGRAVLQRLHASHDVKLSIVRFVTKFTDGTEAKI